VYWEVYFYANPKSPFIQTQKLWMKGTYWLCQTAVRSEIHNFITTSDKISK